MLPVAGRPFLEYVVLALARSGFHRLVISVGYRGDAISQYFGDGSRWRVSIGYARESTPLGTAGAVQSAAGLVSSNWFLIVNGDSFIEQDPNALLADAEAHEALVTIALTRTDQAGRFGSVVIGQNGWVTSFDEKQARRSGRTINAGMYACSRQVVDWIGAHRPASLERETLPALADARRLRGLLSDGYFVDMGTREAYERLERHPQPLLTALNLPGEAVATRKARRP
jgi:NDP-sugar pyrophosphorylase family protein